VRKIVVQLVKISAHLFLCGLLLACTQHHALQTPLNPGDQLFGTKDEKGVWVRHKGPVSTVFATNFDCQRTESTATSIHYRADKPLNTLATFVDAQAGKNPFDLDMPLSPGDMFELEIENGDGFNGRYVVNPDGRIQLPLIPSLTAEGLTVPELSEKIELSLVRALMFRPRTAKVSARVLLWAPVEVYVSGAVFQPGRVLINEKIQAQLVEQRMAAFGDYSPTRYLSEALRAASGVRPDAKLDQVILVRKGWQVEVNMAGIFTGEHVQDISLVAGDRVIVPTTGCFQKQLVRPTQITPKGFRVFLSNLVVPSLSNSSAAVGKFSSSLPYGSRLLQAAVSANCTGGTQWTNAARKVVLASENPLTGQVQVIERSIEQIMRQAHRDEINPYLMPNDAIACYDSDISNVRDIARTLIEVISPLKLL